jgi:hypothetical protein
VVAGHTVKEVGEGRGYHFGSDGLALAAKTIERLVARAIRLHEQEPGEADASARLGSYVERWVSGLSMKTTIHPDRPPRRRAGSE